MTPAILLSPAIWLCIALAGLAGMTKLWLAERDALASFRGAVEAAGKAQEERTQARLRADRGAQERSDARYQDALAALQRDLARMRQQPRPEPRILPAAPAGSACPAGWRCFDRAGFDAALAEYQAAVGIDLDAAAGLIGEGAAVKLRLDEAIRWAGETLNPER